MQIGTFARHIDQVRDAIPKEPDFIDLRMDLDYSLDFREVRKLLGDAAIGCTLHLPSDPNWRPMDLAREIIPFIDIGAEVGAELVTIHTTLSTLFYSDQAIDMFLDQVPLACDAAKEIGVQLALETLGLYYTELALMFERCPDVQIALDIGHGQIMALRNRALAILDSFPDRIAMVNVHDNHGKDMVGKVVRIRKERKVERDELRELAREYDSHLSIGEGSIDFKPIFSNLKQRSYSGKLLLICSEPSKFHEERKRLMDLWLKA